MYCALSGENYYNSAKKSYFLVLEHAATLSFIENISFVFIFIFKFFTAALTTLICFLLLKVQNKVDSVILPLILIFLISYIIGNTFIEMLSYSAKAILQCFLYDVSVGLCDYKHIPRSINSIEIKTVILKSIATVYHVE